MLHPPLCVGGGKCHRDDGKLQWLVSQNTNNRDCWTPHSTAYHDAPLTSRGVGVMVHVDSKPLALPFSSLVVGTAQ